MARPKNQVPTYRLHKSSGTARCWVAGKWITLGKYNSDASRKEYARIVAEVTASPAGGHVAAGTPDISVNELILRFWRFAEKHYRHPSGEPTNEINNFKVALRPLRELYGHTAAKDFGPLALRAVRGSMVAAKLCRTEINARVGRVRRVMKWAVSVELIPASVLHALQAVTGLQAGRCDARESEPVAPVSDEHVDATLPHLNRHVRGLVEFQRLTGCRPGEACRVRRSEIDASGDVWHFTPSQHKTSYRGRRRVIAIGPKAQAVLAAFPTDAPTDFVFSPAREQVERVAARTAARKTPRWPSHMARNSAKRKGAARTRKPGERYTTASYQKAVTRACEKAGVKPWHPNQLRHSFATAVRKAHGLEAAQVLLGHSSAVVTQVYAERDDTLAAAVALKMG